MSGKQAIVDLGTVKELKGILGSNRLVVVDFSAKWCDPCKQLHPLLKGMVERGEMSNAAVVYVDIDKHPDLTMKYEVDGVPMLMLFKEGKPIKMQIGFCGVKETTNMLKRWMAM